VERSDSIENRSNVKALKGDARYRLRVGDWRVIYTLLDDVLVVLVVKDCSPARGLSLTKRSAENAGVMRVDNVLRKRTGRLKAHQFHLKFEAQLRAFVLWQPQRQLRKNRAV
jgi:hypothetical protein